MEKIENQQNINPQSITPPVGVAANMYLLRFGRIFSNLSFLSLFLFLASLVTPIFSLLVPTVLLLAIIFIVVITLGTVFATAPKLISSMWDLLSNSGEFIEKVNGFMFKITPYVVIACLALSIISIVLFSVNKQEKIVWRIVFSSILAVGSLITLIILIAGGAF